MSDRDQTRVFVTVHMPGGQSWTTRLTNWLWQARFGSDPRCEVVVPVPNVSLVHFEVRMSFNGAYIVDRSNGNTIYDGRSLTSGVLPFSQTVTIALKNTGVRIDLRSMISGTNRELAVQSHPLGVPSFAPGRKVARPSNLPASREEVPDDDGPRGDVRITVWSGNEHQEFALGCDEVAIVGRSRVCNLRVPEIAEEISAEHARLSWKNGWLLLEDLGSTNGTTVSGREIECMVMRPQHTPYQVDLARGVARMFVQVDGATRSTPEASAIGRKTVSLIEKEPERLRAKDRHAHIADCPHPACAATRRLVEIGAKLTPGKGRHCELAVLAAAGDIGISDADLVAGRRAYANHLGVLLDGGVANADYAIHARHAADGNVAGEVDAVHPINLGQARVLRTTSSRGVSFDHYVMIGLGFAPQKTPPITTRSVGQSLPANRHEIEAGTPRQLGAWKDEQKARRAAMIRHFEAERLVLDDELKQHEVKASSLAREEQPPMDGADPSLTRESIGRHPGEKEDEIEQAVVEDQDHSALAESVRRVLALHTAAGPQEHVDERREQARLDQIAIERRALDEDRRRLEDERRRFEEQRQLQRIDDPVTGPTLAIGLLVAVEHDWILKLPAHVRDVFRHIDAHGQINEKEATRILGSALEFRKFSKNFDSYCVHVPFAVRVETASGVKCYVRVDR